MVSAMITEIFGIFREYIFSESGISSFYWLVRIRPEPVHTATAIVEI